MKKCSKCQVLKDCTLFSPNKISKDKLESWCKECKRNLEKISRRNKNIKIRKVPKIFDNSKECLYCFEIKTLDNFSINTRGRLGRSSYCISCQKKYNKLKIKSTESKDVARRATAKYREKNRDKWRYLHKCNMLKRRSLYYQANSGLVTKEFLKTIYNTEICFYCKKKIEPENRTCDHIIPFIKGGLHHPDNLVMACFSCNSSKGGKLIEEWIKND